MRRAAAQAHALRSRGARCVTNAAASARGGWIRDQTAAIVRDETNPVSSWSDFGLDAPSSATRRGTIAARDLPRRDPARLRRSRPRVRTAVRRRARAAVPRRGRASARARPAAGARARSSDRPRALGERRTGLQDDDERVGAERHSVERSLRKRRLRERQVELAPHERASSARLLDVSCSVTGAPYARNNDGTSRASRSGVEPTRSAAAPAPSSAARSACAARTRAMSASACASRISPAGVRASGRVPRERRSAAFPISPSSAAI